MAKPEANISRSKVMAGPAFDVHLSHYFVEHRNRFSSTTDTEDNTAAMDIRVLQLSDIPHVQQTNITNLPENYFCKYYMYHALSWPQLSYVAVDVRTPGFEAWRSNAKQSRS